MTNDAAFAQALSLHQQGRLDDAEQLYLAVLSADGAHVSSLLHLGVLRLQQGRNDEAIELTRSALRGDPDNAEAHANLGTALHALARHDEAVAAFETALANDPDRAESYYGLAMALHALKRHDEAIACYERALIIDPDYAEANCGLGAALTVLRRYQRARGCYAQALDVDPDYVEAICGIAETDQALGRHDDAIAGYRKAIALRPELAQAHRALAVALQLAGRHAEALESCRQAVALAPDYGDAQVQLGAILDELGRTAEAQAAFEAAVAIDPGNLGYAFALVAARRVRADDPVLAALEAMEDRLGSMPENEQIQLHFALGKALSDVGRDEPSFRHLLAGNALKRQAITYDEAATRGMLERVRSVFTADLLNRTRGRGYFSKLPVFIVGMPRSGSTLIEQVLASHPRVFGAGERPDFAAAMRSTGVDSAAASFLDTAARLTDAQVRQLGADYVARLRDLPGAEGAERITDKMLANFCLVGLIHLALPDARIIHTSRDPVDTCLSCFSKLFADEQPFTYDLGELGRYHRACDEVMAHWREVMPPGVILDVQYEDVVSDFEPQARRVIAHCGLDWDPACLDFHRTERVVRTASVTQVREPVFRTSVGRWRPDDEVLRPLLDALTRSRACPRPDRGGLAPGGSGQRPAFAS